MIELSVRTTFSAAHQLHGYEGECRHIHGHNFTVTVTIKVKTLNSLGIGVDFKQLKKDVNFYLDQIDHRLLNELEFFQGKNPTSEHIAIWLFNSLAEKLTSDNVSVHSVRVEESEKYGATYYGE